MTAAIIVYVLIVTLPLVAAAALTERVCRMWQWPVRGAWAVTALLIVLIGGRAVGRQLTGPIVSRAATTSSVVQLPSNIASSSISNASETLLTLPRTAATYTAHVIGPLPSRLLAIAWAATSVVMLLLICTVYARVWYARRFWNVAEFAGHRVRVAPNAGPAVVGLFHPEIVVPRWLLDARREDARLIMMHETEHRDARDPLLLVLMWGLVALIPWHPGAWYCLARTRLAIELDCDARVMRRGESFRTYAELLLRQASARLSAPFHIWLGATSLMEPVTNLERRLRAMTTSTNESPAPRSIVRYARTASYLALVSTIAFAACESHVPTAADISGLDAASATQNARQASLISGDQEPTYYVDGVQMSAKDAKAISPDSIRTISIVRGSKEPGGEIRIVTGKQLSLTLKPATADGSTPDGAAPARHVTLRLRSPSTDTTVTNPAVEIDGVPSTAAAMKALAPDRIASVEVVKGPTAMEQSNDPLAKNGLILITLKH